MNSNMTPVCFYSSSWRGGDGWFTHALAEHLAAALALRGRPLLFVASDMQPADRQASDPNLQRAVLPSGDIVRGSKLRKVMGTARRIGAATIALVAARWRTRDYLITFPHWLSATLLQFILLRMLGARITYIVHDPLPHAWRFPLWGRSVEKWLVLLTYRLSNRMVTLTETGRKKMIELGIPADRLVVIPHGIFASSTAVPMQGNRRFLIFGMLRSNKRILETIQAFAEVLKVYPDARLTIAGAPYSAEPEYWQECEQALKGLEGAIALEIGFVPEGRVDALFSDSDAVLAPYIDFSSQSGVAVLAVFSGRPVIGSNSGGIGELFSAGMSGVAIQGVPTVESIRQAMLSFCSEAADVWDQRSRVAKMRVELEMSWAAVAKRYVNVFCV